MLYSITRILYQVRRRRELGVALVIGILVFSVIGNSVTFYIFDRDVQVDRDVSIWDSFWYSVISITTIGYGDLSAQSLGARIGTTVFIIFIGLAAFTTALGLTVDWVVEQGRRSVEAWAGQGQGTTS